MRSCAGASWRTGSRLMAVLCLGLCDLVCATGSPDSPLPEPLTLEFALSLADEMHPDLERAGAALQGAQAGQQAAKSMYRPRLNLLGALKAVEPNSQAARVQSTHNDSWVKLRLIQRLYDFGRTGAAVDAATAEIEGREWDFIDIRQQRRLEIMAGYFNVLLADLEYARDNEAMAIAFVRLDRARNRSELGQRSDVELLQAQSSYEQSLQRRRVSEARQLAARSRLAISLNRPGQLSSSLETPALDAPRRKTGDLETLSGQALDDNPGLKALRARIQAAQNLVLSARAEAKPVLRGELEAAAYSRKSLTRDDYSAALVLDVPLVTGGEVDAGVARQRALLRERRAALRNRELEVSQLVLDLWLEIENLRARAGELEILGESRDLDLDLRRSLYEFEVASDLGDAMTEISDYRLQKAENDYQLALAWARLDALTGRLLNAQVGGAASDPRMSGATTE